MAHTQNNPETLRPSPQQVTESQDDALPVGGGPARTRGLKAECQLFALHSSLVCLSS